eukprot:9163657-Pyramimonas_sp.AAC.1
MAFGSVKKLCFQRPKVPGLADRWRWRGGTVLVISLPPKGTDNLAWSPPRPRCFFLWRCKVGAKVWRCAFERFGGKQLRAFFWLPDIKTNAEVKEFYELPDDAINAGSEYFLKNAPRCTADLKQLIGQTKALRNGAPLHGWPIALVATALSGLAAE